MAFGLGDTVDDIVGGVFGYLKDKQETDRIEATNANIESQLARTQKRNDMIVYGVFGLLFIGALVAINKSA